MEDKVAEQISRNLKSDPSQWEQIRKTAEKLRLHYSRVIEQRRKTDDKILHFGAYVAYDSMYGMHEVFCLMKASPERWDPKVVIIPDVCRGYDHQKQTYQKTREYFVKLYGADSVLDGWDMKSDTYIDRTEELDIIYFADPYDAMAHRLHSIQYASTKNVLPVYVNYGFDVGYNTMYSRMKGAELNYVWKYFTETVYSREDCNELQIIQGKNVVMTGYPKMDSYVNYPKLNSKSRKKILITSHHSTNFPELPLSNFLSYYMLFLRLPEMFPKIDFVFRPHPFLFMRLINQNTWTKEQADEYLKELERVGVEYSCGGEYLSLFSECDAIINDCGSFTLEWLFTGKPGCFLLNKNLTPDYLTTQMNEAITRYTPAHSFEDIIQFITDVDNGKYSEENEMDEWTKNNIAINYPNASEKILEEMDILKGRLL